MKRELDSLFRELREEDPTIEVETEFYVSHQPTEISREEPVVRAVHENHARVMGSEPVYRRRTAYMDSSALNSHGIPTVVYGASGQVNTTGDQKGWSPEQGEHINLEDFYQGTEVVAGAVVDLCSSTDPSHLRG